MSLEDFAGLLRDTLVHQAGLTPEQIGAATLEAGGRRLAIDDEEECADEASRSESEVSGDHRGNENKENEDPEGLYPAEHVLAGTTIESDNP